MVRDGWGGQVRERQSIVSRDGEGDKSRREQVQ